MGKFDLFVFERCVGRGAGDRSGQHGFEQVARDAELGLPEPV